MSKIEAKKTKSNVKRQLMAYNPKWPTQAQAEMKELRRLIRHDLLHAIEHIGSTAVPGLPSMPVLDIAVLVPSLQEAQKLIPRLKSAGYQFWDKNPDKDQLLFVKDAAPGNKSSAQTVTLLADRTEFSERLTFRDYLRGHTDAAKAYAVFKIHLVTEFGNDTEGYSKAKTGFVLSVLELARR